MGAMQSHKFGTFGGVFTPSVLTILGVIMFLRFPMVVGYAGLWNALLILAAAKAISVITALSVSSIATNMRVKGGGAYYLISRSLGVEFGGAIAIFFFIAQAVAVTLYVVGFTEAVYNAFPDLGISFRVFATITNTIVFLCVYIGAGWTIKIQYGILAVLVVSILSFFAGVLPACSLETLASNAAPQWSDTYSFFTVFAIFFPAVTGIMAGVNMSGDLQEPARSIPRGTFAAIGFSGFIYVAITVALAAGVPRAALLGEGFVMQEYAYSSTLVYAGVFCATLSSALGSMMGAPRILQAFARDGVFPWLRWFGQGSAPAGEPRRATVLTFLIAQLGVLAGDLNAIAPVITMFFLLTYGAVNLACFYEGRSNNPSFRPTFRYNHWSIAFVGNLGCVGVMFLMNPLWAVVALVLGAVVFFYIARSEINVRWGDLAGGLAFQVARNALLRLERERYHPKNWRPSILVLSGGAFRRLRLVEYACWFAVDSGIVSIAQIITGNLDQLHKHREEAENILRKFIIQENLPAFPVVVADEDFHSAFKGLLQCHGIGGMKPNTVLLGMSEDQDKEAMFWDVITTAKDMRRSLIVVASACEEECPKSPGGEITVWWDSVKNGELILLLCFMLKKNREWRDCPLRIVRPVPRKADVESIEREMAVLLGKARIEAEVVIVPTDNAFFAVKTHMHASSVLFKGFDPDVDIEHRWSVFDGDKTMSLCGDIIFVYNAGGVSLEA
ncbi:MAG TPA: amino acid permease [Desulfomicrobiaceae bacterium]|jgi:amino acid transporter|nr:amino acid permease [Desulfomicrobiaceae bacterium]